LGKCGHSSTAGRDILMIKKIDNLIGRFLAVLVFLLAISIPAVFLVGLSPIVNASPAYAPTIHRERVTINVPGVSGTDGNGATATTSAVVAGQVLRVDVDFKAITTTSDLTITGTSDGVAGPVVLLSNTATDIRVYPAITLTSHTATALTYDDTHGVLASYPVADQLTLTLSQTTALTPAAVVDIFWKD
jgi:hypothetical protein